MPFPFPFTMFGSSRASNVPAGATCDFTYCYGGDWVQGKVGNYGIEIDGGSPGSYIDVPVAAVSGQAKGTFAAWFYRGASMSGYPTIFGAANSAGSVGYWQFYMDGASGIPGFAIQNAGTTFISSFNASSAIPIGSWTHLAVRQDGTNATIWMNGEQENTRTNAAWFDDVTSISECQIGTMIYGSGPSQTPSITGSVDEVAIWDVPLTPAQISLLSTGSARADSFTPPTLGGTSWVTGTTGSAGVGNITSSYALEFDSDYVDVWRIFLLRVGFGRSLTQLQTRRHRLFYFL